MTARALVTGAAGFVGRHMLDALERDDYDVVGYDIATATGHDVRQAWSWAALNPPWDLAVHCAAVVGGRTMIDGAPLELACHDLAIDAAFFDWCRRARPRHVVYYSSSAAYPVDYQTRRRAVFTAEVGHPEQARLTERQINQALPLPPDQTYGWVKLTGERLARELAAACPDVRVHVLRPFSGYGEDQDLAYPFPAIAQRAARGDRPVTYWGNPDQCRDWVHIEDVIGATLAVVEADYRQPVNICTGVATRFEDLAQLLADEAVRQGGAMWGVKPQLAGSLADEPFVRCEPGNPTGVHYRVGDPSTMLEFYTPTITVEEGAARAVAYAKEHRC